MRRGRSQCPACGYDNLVQLSSPFGVRYRCSQCGREAMPGVTDDRDNEHAACDRCSETAPLPQTLIHGPLDDPNEVVCVECIEPRNRVI